MYFKFFTVEFEFGIRVCFSSLRLVLLVYFNFSYTGPSFDTALDSERRNRTWFYRSDFSCNQQFPFSMWQRVVGVHTRKFARNIRPIWRKINRGQWFITYWEVRAKRLTVDPKSQGGQCGAAGLWPVVIVGTASPRPATLCGERFALTPYQRIVATCIWEKHH